MKHLRMDGSSGGAFVALEHMIDDDRKENVAGMLMSVATACVGGVDCESSAGRLTC